MGILTNFFEAERKEERERLSRVLVVVDSNPASEALVRMLEVYYARDEDQDKYMATHRPYINILDTALSADSLFQERRPASMEYTANIDTEGKSRGRIGLLFRNGKILKSIFEKNGSQDVVSSFTSDSRGEASSILWSKIISSYAGKGEYDVVLYPDTATRIASKVLRLTSQGRGFTLPWECGTLVKMPNGTPI